VKTKLSGVLALLLALTMIAAACGSDDDDSADGDNGGVTGTIEEAPEDRCEATVPGTQIDYGVFAPTTSLDPPFVSGSLVGGTELINVYDALMTFDFETNEFVPRLAESLESNDDFTVWTLKLRDDITYSDGTALDAQMVADNMDRYLEPGVRNTSGGFMTTIESKEAIDPLTLEVTLSEPWSEFGLVFADEPGLVVNLNAIGADAQAFGAQPPDAAGVGPYVVERNVPGEELVMTARQDYWDGPVCIETLRFVFVPGAQATYDAFRSNDVNVAFLRDDPVITTAIDAGAENFFIEQQAGGGFVINHREGRPGADIKVREAIGLAVDIDVINDRAFNGDMSVYKALVAPDSRLYSDAVEEMATDLEAARTALDEAKANGYDGQIDVLCANAPPAPETSLALEALLESVGFDVNVTNIPTSDQIGQVIAGDYDVACWGMNAGPETGMTSFNRNLRSDSPSNRQGYGNPAMDDALDALFAAPDDEARQEAMAEINSIYNEDWVGVIYGAPREGIIWADNIKGILPSNATTFLFGNAYISD
jgi:peptide/nickel transport system substrate-binding protein